MVFLLTCPNSTSAHPKKYETKTHPPSLRCFLGWFGGLAINFTLGCLLCCLLLKCPKSTSTHPKKMKQTKQQQTRTRPQKTKNQKTSARCFVCVCVFFFVVFLVSFFSLGLVWCVFCPSTVHLWVLSARLFCRAAWWFAPPRVFEIGGLGAFLFPPSETNLGFTSNQTWEMETWAKPGCFILTHAHLKLPGPPCCLLACLLARSLGLPGAGGTSRGASPSPTPPSQRPPQTAGR